MANESGNRAYGIPEPIKGTPLFEYLLPEFGRYLTDEQWQEMCEFTGARTKTRDVNAYEASRKKGNAIVSEPFLDIMCAGPELQKNL